MSDGATAFLHAILLGGMILLLMGGLLGILALWYLRGRDPRAGLVADILPQPPDDLPPGAVGTLVDERADHNDVVATLVGLGRHEAVTFHPVVDDRGRVTDHDVSVIDPERVDTPLERDLLHTLFGKRPETANVVRLSAAKERFIAATETIRQDLYAELIERNYFLRNPETTRRRWKLVGMVGLVLSVLIGVVLAIRIDAWFLLPTMALVVVWSTLIYVSRWLPRKTLAGAEAAATWNAFRRYLVDLQRQKDLPEASEIFDRYLPYAIAFKIDKEWVRSFARMGVERPGWYGPDLGNVILWGDPGIPPIMIGGSDVGDVAGGLGDMVGDAGMPDVGMPDVDLNGGFQSLSDVAGGGLQDISGGLGSLLDSAGSIFDNIDIDIGN